MLPTLSESMTKRFLPQYDQFGFDLRQQGSGFVGKVDSLVGQGTAWVMPVSSHCLVLEHNIVPSHDMQLLELTPSPYACVSEVSESTIECMPEANISPASVKRQSPSPLSNSVCTFVQHECGEGHSPLKQGHLYYSRSIILEPSYFRELERQYPGQFEGLFEAFGSSWNDTSSQAICTTLHSLRAERLLAPGAHLYAKSAIGAMVAELAADATAIRTASARHGSKAQSQLTLRTTALIEQQIRSGIAPTLNGLAEELFVSRSVLCAAFKQETGISIGAFVRQKRSRIAEEMLLDGSLDITQIAAKLGFARQSSFSQAFKQSHGMSPSQWRAANR